MLVFGQLDAIHDMEPVAREKRIRPALLVSHHLPVDFLVTTAIQQLQKLLDEQSRMPDATRVVEQGDVEMRSETGSCGHFPPGVDCDPPQKRTRLGAIGTSKTPVERSGCD